MKSLLISTLLVFTVGPFCIYEALRFYHANLDCEKQHRENAEILKSTTCDAWHLHSMGNKVTSMCKEAYAENQITPHACAWRRMWTEGEVMRVWTMLTDSHLMLWATMVPLVGLILYLWIASRNERLREERLLKMQESMYEKTLAMIQPPSPVSLDTQPGLIHHHKRRLRRQDSYIELVNPRRECKD